MAGFGFSLDKILNSRKKSLSAIRGSKYKFVHKIN